MNIEALNLPVRCYNILKRSNLHEVEDILKYSRDQLLRIRCAREDDIDAIEAALDEIGLHLSSFPRPSCPPPCPSPRPSNEACVTRYCYVERYPELLQGQLKLRGLYNKIDFATVTRHYVASIPGMTPALLKELTDELDFCGIQFAENKTTGF